jgi:hypothetical protein
MGKTWTGTKEHSKLSWALISAGSDSFPSRVLPLLRSAFHERLGTALPVSLSALGRGHLVWPATQPSFLIASCLWMEGKEIGAEQTRQCLDAIRFFGSSGLQAEIFLLIHNQDHQGQELRDSVQKELQALVDSGQARTAELWNRQKVLQEAFDGMLRHTVSLLQERSLSTERFEALPTELAPLEQVPSRVATLLIDQHGLKDIIETDPLPIPADAILDREEGTLSLLIGEFGLGKTTTVARAAARTPGQLLYVAGAGISRDEVHGAKDFLIRCFDQDMLLAGFPEEEHPTFRLLSRPAVEYILKGNTALALAVVVDGIDESGILSRRGGFQHLFNMFHEVRVPTLFTMRTEMWIDGQKDFASAFGSPAGHGERRNRKVRLVELLPWDVDQIRTLIRRFRDGRPDDAEKSRLEGLEHLLDNGEFELLYGDIPRRPLFLQMILDTVTEEGIPRLRVGRARLLHDWVRRKIRRDIEEPEKYGMGRAPLVAERETSTTVEDVAWEAMVRAAAAMVERVEGVLELKPDCLLNPLLASSPRLAQIVEPQALFLHSLLLPVRRETLGSARRVRFAHRTFQEFFLAWCSLTDPEALPDSSLPPAVEDWVRQIREDKELMDHDSITERQRSPVPSPSKSSGAVQPPDLELRVVVEQDGSRMALTYFLHSAAGKAKFHHEKIQGPELMGSPDAFAAALFEKIEKLHEGFDPEGGALLLKDAEQELSNLGQGLYRELFPREMRAVYRRFRGDVKTLQITSDEPWIPWELIKPYDDEGETVVDDPYFCEKFQLTRWLAGDKIPAPILPVVKLASVGADTMKGGRQLPNATKEHELLAGLASRHPGIVHASLPEATFDDLGSLLRGGGLGLLHFVGHGDVLAERSNEAKIVLQDRPFRASNLSGTLQTAIKKDRPLVFLNACRVARQGWSLSGLGGWAEAWVRTCGCGAFIGPQWVVKDSLALEFARVFYQELDAEKTFGEAVTAARIAVRKKDPGRPTWLAYAAYGHPGARLAFGPGAGIVVEGGGRAEVENAAADWPPNVPPRPVRTNAPAAPEIFLGRGRDVERLKERLGIGQDKAPSSPVQVLTAVRGWPGVGKTSLAAFLANDPDIQSVYEGVLWASIGQEPDILGEMAAWGRWLGNDDLRQAANLKEAQTALRSLLRERRMILVLDDVWDPAHAALFQSVGGPGCPVLLTTRETAIAQALASRPEAVHFLDVLDTESAVDLLRALAGDVVDQHPVECRRLVEDLEKLPLALQVAGRLLRSESALGWGVDDLLRELGDGTAVLRSAAPPDRADLDRLSLPTVSALFQRSTDRLNPELRNRYRLLGGFAAKPATFGLDLLNLVWKIEDPRPSVRELVGRGLLEPAGDGRFQIHALLLLHATTLAPCSVP